MIGVELLWLLAMFLLVTGMHRMSSPRKALSGLRQTALAILIALVATLIGQPPEQQVVLLVVAIVAGAGGAVLIARRAAGLDIPLLIALFNGLGGLAAVSIAAAEMWQLERDDPVTRMLAIGGGLFASVAMAGSFGAALRIQGRVPRWRRYANRQVVYLANVALLSLLGLILAASPTAHPALLAVFVVLAMSFGLIMAMPTALADLPILVSIFNALTGLAVALDGVLLGHPVMIVAGALVFAAGALLTRLMARAVNRRLGEVMYSGFGIVTDGRSAAELSAPDRLHHISEHDAALQLAFARHVVVVPGYGMAVAQAQHKLRELTQLLNERDVPTEFAIHPVAGRMPGHMDVLLAGAGVPYDTIVDLDAMNPRLSQVDVVLVVGASDIVNPLALSDTDNPLQGMPILEVHRAERVIVLDHRAGLGYSGVENTLLKKAVTRVMLGDARVTVQQIINDIKLLG